MFEKLVICSPQLGISPESNSGGEVYDREVIKAFCEQGAKVIIILPKNKPYVSHKNLKVYYLPFFLVWPPYLFNIFVIPYLFWIYHREKFNILRIHSPYFVGLGALFFKLFYPKIPLIVTYHHLEENQPFFDLINRLFINKWSVIIADSQFTREEIIKKYKIDKGKIKVVYAGVRKEFKPVKRKESLIIKYNIDGKRILLFLGELKLRKNVGFLLRVIKEINLSNARLLICGKGKLYKQLLNQVKKLKITDKVTFTGFIPEKRKVDYYNLADVFLFPSKKEGFGMPIIEAASCGIPSIASDASSLKELIIDSKTGYLVQLNNVGDWKSKIEDLLQDDKKRKKMGKMAEKFSHNFSWQKSAQTQLKIYGQFLK